MNLKLPGSVAVMCGMVPRLRVRCTMPCTVRPLAQLFLVRAAPTEDDPRERSPAACWSL